MAKTPAFQFYPGDWLRDNVSGCSIAAQGLWLRILFLMHDSERRGYLQANGIAVPDEMAARRCGVTLEEYNSLLQELEIANVPSRTKSKILYSRRMVRDEGQREYERKRKQNQRSTGSQCPGNVPEMSHDCPGDVPAMSRLTSSSTSSSTSTSKLKSNPLSPPTTEPQSLFDDLDSAPSPNGSGLGGMTSNQTTKRKTKPSKPQQAYSQVFEQFWAITPERAKRCGKPTAYKSFVKQGLDDNPESLAAAIQSLEAWKKSYDWTKNGGEFVPHLTTWLNQERWKIIPAASTNSDRPGTVRERGLI